MLLTNTITSRIRLYDTAPTFVFPPKAGEVAGLDANNTGEVLTFLSIRPVHTVVMTSFINDNGIVSDLNRGKFYGYRNAAGELEGVALIGHTTLVEARSDAALRALAATARTSETPLHMVMSSGDDAGRFWQYLTNGLTAPRLTCTEALFEVSFPFAVQKCERDIENASMDHLLQVAEAQAEVAFIESGVDPMVRDREGFLKRVARRIEQNRVFVVTEGDKVIFKADIIAETDSVIYLEGIWVAPEHRGNGFGSRCLSALSLELLNRVEHISLLSNVTMNSAHRSFAKAGFRRTDECTTLFV
jgi:uncharacterized protein